MNIISKLIIVFSPKDTSNKENELFEEEKGVVSNRRTVFLVTLPMKGMVYTSEEHQKG